MSIFDALYLCTPEFMPLRRRQSLMSIQMLKALSWQFE
jgi:hypothetical protein